MRDPFGRDIDYLRISVTDRCNLRCIYCIPEGMEWIEKADILSYEEIERLVRILGRLGLRRLRLTGGEPTVRRQLPRLVEMLAAIEGTEEISLSTNGLKLTELAAPLRRAGLSRVNVSLDSLDEGCFREITRGGDLRKVLAGIEAAEKEGLLPIKINVVVMRGKNDGEITDFALLTQQRPWNVRFIEMMPLEGNVGEQEARYVSTDEVRRSLEALGGLEPAEAVRGNGPATYFRYPGAPGTVGFISPLNHNFCDRCNRLRLTANGRLRLCLFGDNEIDLATPLRAGRGEEEIAEKVLGGLMAKPQRHYLELGSTASRLIALSQVGG
ncbi:MAG: GTP 3',8-cyclase MoaA [Acidobacteria bacterium]|nr:MAG: GTP 3',8-cyclase MoaA [Acidobacteriota bacterium]